MDVTLAAVVFALLGSLRAICTTRGAVRTRRRVVAAPGTGWPAAALPGAPGFVLRRVGGVIPAEQTRRWWNGWIVALAIVGLVVVANTSPVVAAVVLATCIGVSWRSLGALERVQRRRIEAALPLVAESTARGLRAGQSLVVALGAAAAVVGGAAGIEVGDVAAAAHLVGADQALRSWTVRHPHRSVQLLAATLRLGATSGGAPARALDAVGDTLRERLGVAAEARALAAQAQASAAVMLVAPVVFCGLLVLSDADASRFLLRSPLGLACLALGVGLDSLGALWMRRILRRAAS